MSSIAQISLLLMIIHGFSCSDLYKTGQEKYEQILSLSSTKSTCWQHVLSMLQNYCSLDQLEKYQSSIAYQFTLCHLAAMNSDISDLQCNEPTSELCVEKLHKHMNAFIAYTEFYPFVQSVCYVLREKSYQSELTTHLTLFLNNSQEIITGLISSINLQNQLTDKIQHQQYLQETVLTNAMKLKHLARTNIEKTQDILSNVIQAARHEYDLLKQICALSQTIQTIVRITCTYSFWFYILSTCALYILTIPKRTNRARSILFCTIFIYISLERYYQMSSIINFYQWRCTWWICCLFLLLHYAYKYRSRKEIDHEQLTRINSNLRQTEETFHRVSRELKRARSKSRSRSRSIRAQRQADKLSSSPLIHDHPPSIPQDENKENTPQVTPNPISNYFLDEENDQSSINPNTNKRRYSLLVPSSAKTTRIVLRAKQIHDDL